MITYSSAVTIDRPPAQVFPYFVEREKQALWSDVPMRPLTDGPWRVGYRMELAFGKGPLKATLQLEITGLEQDRLVTFRTASKGSIDWSGEYRLAPAGMGGSQVSQAGQMRFSGLWRLLEPVVGAEIRSGEIKELDRLKAVVEAGG